MLQFYTRIVTNPAFSLESPLCLSVFRVIDAICNRPVCNQKLSLKILAVEHVILNMIDKQENGRRSMKT